MASVAMLFKTILLFNLISHFSTGTVHLPPIEPKLVNISDQWQRRGFIHQEKDIKEVIVKQGVEHLHLVCAIDPALPLTEEHFSTRNNLVKFEKVYPDNDVVNGTRYWSDDQQFTGVALDTRNIGLFGTYSCSYGHIKQTVEVLAEDNGVLKDLSAPKTLEEMFSFAFVKKNNNKLENKMQPVVGNKMFHCDQKSEMKATSVHRLKPSDIGVVATLGDSIMVGLGARAVSLQHFFTEYRGVSWSNGGDSTIEEVVTLPNILKRFNPHLRGYSKGNGRHFDKTSGLNMATVSSTSRDLERQAKGLVNKIKEDKEINFEEDWKLVTVMIGSRDLCRLCYDKTIISPDEYITSLMKALDTLQDDLPRTFVNLVLPLNVTALGVFYQRSDCLLKNWSICPCLQDNFMRKKMSNFLQGYKRLVYELIDSGIYDRKENFTVVIQPMFENWSFVQQDRDLFSLDCLHLSSKGNALAATLLWNNMVEPIKRKNSQRSDTSIKCLTKESPYLFTHKNSESENSLKSDHDDDEGMNGGVIAALSLSIICALCVIAAFVFVKHKLRTPVEKLRFNNRPWLKYYI